MNHESSAYVPKDQKDRWIQATAPQQAAAFYGYPWPDGTVGQNEVRLQCLFNEPCHDSTYGNMQVNLDKWWNPVYCHSCHIRGDLLCLMWGMKYRTPFEGDRLRGGQFKEMMADLRTMNTGGESPIPAAAGVEAAVPRQKAPVEAPEQPGAPAVPAALAINVPLKDSDNERARELVNLNELFVTDIGAMNPAVAAYVRARPYLTPELMERWAMGYLPSNAKGLLRGHIVYGMFDEHDDVLSWFGRDVYHDAKMQKWAAAGCDPAKKPAKHRFVKGFHRGLELFGQNGRRRIQENPHLRESLQRLGLVVVEGPNDVMRLDAIGVAAVGLCSNHATDEQVRKMIRFAKETAGGRIVLMGDNDEQGEAGFKELLWRLSSCGDIETKLGWSKQSHAGQFDRMQPEDLSDDQWHAIVPGLLRRTDV